MFIFISIFTFIPYILSDRALRAPQHPKLAIWCSDPIVPHSTRSWRYGSECSKCSKPGGREDGGEKKGGKEGWKEGRREEGDAPLLKSRDPHLAGGNQREIVRK